MVNINQLQARIRNFAIIAHIDHGKSTLADRFLEITGILKRGCHQGQYLDRNPISRERGITIKLAPVRMVYNDPKLGLELGASDSEYILNLIDTPGHVDFSYEVDRTLACVEGVILLVDATQGIQAQTLANAYKAIEKNLVIIPAVNKIDLAQADVLGRKRQLAQFLGVDEKEIYPVSAKTGEGVEELLKGVVSKIPPPKSINPTVRKNQFQGLVFDSYLDPHRGVIVFIRVFQGKVRSKDRIWLAQRKIEAEVLEAGIFTPDLKPVDCLSGGEIGYLVTNIKDIHQLTVGETVVIDPRTPPLPGYRKVKPMVFASGFPVDPQQYLDLKKALEQIYLTDSALDFKPIYSQALGSGFRIGFLGMLHADVVRERLEREFYQEMVLTPPQIEFIKKEDGFYEPYVLLTIVTPKEYLGRVMEICRKRRAVFRDMDNRAQIVLVYEMPLAEMMEGFFDDLKSVSSGYGSFDWQFLEFRKTDAAEVKILINGEEVNEFTQVVVRAKADKFARRLLGQLRKVIPRQLFEVRLQAKYKGKIIASERIAPLRKNVTAKLYGGDRTRKDKLLEKQKKGKKRMKMIGKVEIPKEGFIQLFKKAA